MLIENVPDLHNTRLTSCVQKLDFQPITRALVWELNVRAAVTGWCHLTCPEEGSHCKIWSLAPLLLCPWAHDIKTWSILLKGKICDLADYLQFSWLEHFWKDSGWGDGPNSISIHDFNILNVTINLKSLWICILDPVDSLLFKPEYSPGNQHQPTKGGIAGGKQHTTVNV
jgi:hypothetical protein